MGKTCCFTGHRPDKLDITTKELEKRLRKAIDEAIADGVTVFITGMAPGTDLIAGKIVLEHGDSGIRLICAVPFPNQSRPFSYEWKEIYNHILENADIVHLVCKEYSRQSFLRRDEWMVDRADCVIAAYSGTRGGTRYTINYAKKKGIPVKNILEVKQNG